MKNWHLDRCRLNGNLLLGNDLGLHLDLRRLLDVKLRFWCHLKVKLRFRCRLDVKLGFLGHFRYRLGVRGVLYLLWLHPGRVTVDVLAEKVAFGARLRRDTVGISSAELVVELVSARLVQESVMFTRTRGLLRS